MKRMIILMVCIQMMHPLKAQTVLFECGQNSGHNFNGWYISPYAIFDAIEFDEHSAAFFSEYGGTFTVSLSKKIDALVEYQSLNLLFNFEEIHNARIENVVYYTSADGKKWHAVQQSKNNTAIRIANDSLTIQYVRAEVQATFFKNGQIACDYVKIEGERKVTSDLAPTPIVEDDWKETFYIFNYLHTVNVETGLESPYEVLITSISGQIVYREQLTGSQRLDLPGDLNGIFIVTIIHDNAFQASKKIVVSSQ